MRSGLLSDFDLYNILFQDMVSHALFNGVITSTLTISL